MRRSCLSLKEIGKLMDEYGFKYTVQTIDGFTARIYIDRPYFQAPFTSGYSKVFSKKSINDFFEKRK